MIKAVGFDLWETLITDTPDLSKRQERLRLARMEEILALAGYTGAAAEIERAYRALWHRCLDLYWSADVDVPCRRQIEHFLEALGLNPASFPEPVLAAMESAYANAAVEIPPATVDGAHALLTQLRTRGIGIGLISNTGRTPGYALRDILRAAGLSPLIDVMIFSNEHGVCKPQPSIFEELRRGLGARYDEMLFVGDNLYVDVLGARRVGMRGVHFVPLLRGTAVAPAVEHEPVEPDATITELADLIRVIDTINLPSRA
jgi:putative hydrolase of the HAD superfamily